MGTGKLLCDSALEMSDAIFKPVHSNETAVQMAASSCHLRPTAIPIYST